MKIVVVIPVYNEGKRALETVGSILKNINIDIVVVNDGSTDNSGEMIKEEFDHNGRVIVLDHLINLGKGAAMKTGVKVAFKIMRADGVVFIDADGQHNPKYLPKFVDELQKFPVVFGYRELNKNAPWIRRNGNKFAGWLINILFNIKRKDLLCGFLGFRKVVYKKIKWKSNRYGIETEMATKVGKNKIPFSEIKIDTIYIDKYKGVTIFDAFKILFKIPFWYFEK